MEDPLGWKKARADNVARDFTDTEILKVCQDVHIE